MTKKPTTATAVKYLGISIIVCFCIFSMLLYSIEKEMSAADDKSGILMAYPSFFEDHLFDFRTRFRLNSSHRAKNIVLLHFNDESLKKIGRWPWSRRIWVKVFDKLKDYGAKTVAFDVFLSEPEESPSGSPDQLLADSFRKFQSTPGNTVLIPYSMNIGGSPLESDFKEIPDELYDFVLESHSIKNANLREHFVSKDVYPITEILSSSPALGHIQSLGDVDGVFRHYHLVSNADGFYLPSFALMAYQAHTGDKARIVIDPGDDQAQMHIRTGSFPVNPDGTVKIRWFGGTQSFEKISVHDFLDDDGRHENLFDGSLVFIASTAFGAHDVRHTPIDVQMPGVYTHMNTAQMLLQGTALKPRSLSVKYSWYILFACVFLTIAVQLLGNPIADLATLALLVGGAAFIDHRYLAPEGYEISLFFCLLAIVGCYSWTTFLNFYLSRRDKAFLQEVFGTYLSPKLINQMYASGQRPQLGGEAGIRTALFTDVANFSTISEKLSPTELVELLNEYLTAMTDILLEEGGTLDKYEGDAIIAFFGAPIAQEDHALRACTVAYRMQEELARLRTIWSSKDDRKYKTVSRMRMRIGINTGKIVTGNMGSIQRMNYTMMGDAVNTAARLESSAKYYGVAIQASQETRDRAGQEWLWRRLDTVRPVGKSTAVATFELLGPRDEADGRSFELVDLFERGIGLYGERRFDEALGIFEQALECEPHGNFNPSTVYMERCRNFRQRPPAEDWDGIWQFKDK